MATYAIGDIQGCYDGLQELLKKINFNPKEDTLWFTGDLVNGGAQPTETLRFIKSLGDKAITVLGNHDLVLLGVANGNLADPQDREIGLEQILKAPDLNELMLWLSQRPLVHYDSNFNALLVHAGVLPQWNLTKVLNLAQEVEVILRSPQASYLYSNMYGNKPDIWDDALTNWDRSRFIINCFTRMRFCDANAKLEFTAKRDINSAPNGFMPWFNFANRAMADIKIIFGHWAALDGNTGVDNAICVDTGYVWGRTLTALRLDDWQVFTISAPY